MGVTVTTGTSVTSISGFTVYSSMRLGSNGDPNGDWEFAIGGFSGSPTTGHEVWDDNPDGSIASGPVAAALTVTSDGGVASFGVADGLPDTLTISTGTMLAGIASVQVRSIVLDVGCWFDWGTVYAKFYNGTTLTETLSAAIRADSTDTGSGATIQTLGVFVPAVANNTKVVVSGMPSLYYNDDEIDSPDSVSGQIYVFTA